MRQAASDIVDLLTVPLASMGPILKAGDENQNAILELAKILKRADTHSFTPFFTQR